MLSCAAMVSAYLYSVPYIERGKDRIYQIPRSKVNELSLEQYAMAVACALRHGIKYKIVEDVKTGRR